jgi:tetratricopeptide (TPR) repeat protein
MMQRSQDVDDLSLLALLDQVAAARQDGNRRVEQELQLQLARVWCQRAQFDRAMEAFVQAYVLSISTRDERLHLQALLGLGSLSLRSHQIEQASVLLEMGLEYAREQADQWAEAECLSGLGHAALLSGNPPRAILLAERARAVIREYGDRVAEADVMNLLAVAHTRLGQVGQAASLHHEGVMLAREWRKPTVEAYHLSNLGILLVCQLAQPEEGMADLARALELFQEQEENEGAAQTLALLAAGAQHQQSWEESLRYIELARALPHGLKWLEYRLGFLAADAFAALGRREESLFERGRALASFRRSLEHAQLAKGMTALWWRPSSLS